MIHKYAEATKEMSPDEQRLILPVFLTIIAAKGLSKSLITVVLGFMRGKNTFFLCQLTFIRICYYSIQSGKALVDQFCILYEIVMYVYDTARWNTNFFNNHYLTSFSH